MKAWISRINAVLSGEGEDSLKTMRYRRLNTEFVSTDPFTGLYLAAFGSHGPEVLQLSREPDPHDVSGQPSAAAAAAVFIPAAAAPAAVIGAVSPQSSTLN